MRFAYEIQNKTVKIRRCYSYGEEIEIPDSLEGYPVTELASYIFSAHWEERKLAEEAFAGQVHFTGEEEAPALCGPRLRKVHLPSTLQKIGAYAFYNCSSLESVSFHGGLKDLGAGLFTGCHRVKQLKLTLDCTGVSCLQEILMELNEELRLILCRENREARLVFPEFYEEGVENTPARILMTQMHGSGMHYRNCFYGKQFDFHAYDSCFFRAKAQERAGLVLELAASRLRFPLGLGAKEKAAYESYLTEHLPEAGAWAVEQRDMGLLRWFIEDFLIGIEGSKEKEYPAKKEYPGKQIYAGEEKHLGQKELLRNILGQAAEQGFTEGSAFLLDALHRHFPAGEESFEF